MVRYGLPSLRIELTNKFRGDPHRCDYSAVRPFSDLIMCPDDDVRALTHRSAQRKIINIFAGVSIVTSIPKSFSNFLAIVRRLALVRYPSRPKAGRWSRQTIPSATDTAPIWPTSPRSQRIAKLYERDAL